MSADGVIGSTNSHNQHGLLWDVPADRKHFFYTTRSKAILYGRKTFEAMGKKPLPKRKNFILSSSMKQAPQGCEIVQNIEDAVCEELVICGGAQVYRLALKKNLVKQMYISIIPGSWQGDIKFPPVDWKRWTLSKASIEQGFILQVWDRKS